MLCWLAFGEHEALKRDMKRAGKLIPAKGKPTILLRLYPADGRETPLRRPLAYETSVYETFVYDISVYLVLSV